MGGDSTAFEGGQVSLNPVPHMTREPFGMLVFPIVSYLLGGWMVGWASAPYSPFWQERHPRRAALMSLAGPAANFALMIIAAVLIRAGIGMGVFQVPQTVGFASIAAVANPETAGNLLRFAATFLSVLFFENLLLGTFNLLPVPPLDGSTGIGILLPETMALRLMRFMQDPMFRMMGLFAAWAVFDKAFDPIFTTALNMLYPGASYR